MVTVRVRGSRYWFVSSGVSAVASSWLPRPSMRAAVSIAEPSVVTTGAVISDRPAMPVLVPSPRR